MKKTVILGVAVMILLSVFAGCAKTGNNPTGQKVSITMNGSTTLFPVAQKWAEVYMGNHPSVDISVEGTGSGNGIAALIDKTTDIANASREIKQEEIDKAKANGVNPYEIPVALDALTVVVNPEVNVENLTKDQVQKIFFGEITNWKEVGGQDLPIVVVTRDTSSGTYGAFVELALDKQEKITNRALIQSSNQTVKNTVATTKGAIGYIGLGYVDSSVKPLKYENVIASEQNVLNKTYKLGRKLYMYTNGQPQGGLKEFVDFCLSQEGQQIVESVGFIKINN
jgi:phosphate transport system substrate-binding protein